MHFSLLALYFSLALYLSVPFASVFRIDLISYFALHSLGLDSNFNRAAQQSVLKTIFFCQCVEGVFERERESHWQHNNKTEVQREKKVSCVFLCCVAWKCICWWITCLWVSVSMRVWLVVFFSLGTGEVFFSQTHSAPAQSSIRVFYFVCTYHAQFHCFVH